MAAELSCVRTLPEFMEAVARITRYYHSSVSSELPGTRLIVKHTRDGLKVEDETWGMVAGTPLVYVDAFFSFRDNAQMFYNGRPLYSKLTFSYSTVTPEDYVTQEVVDDAMDCMTPASMSARCSQMGEPHSTKIDENTGQYRNTYATFSKVSGTWPNGIWKYCGNCFRGETEERGKNTAFCS